MTPKRAATPHRAGAIARTRPAGLEAFWRCWLLIFALLAVASAPAAAQAPAQTTPKGGIIVVDMSGAIGVAAIRQLSRALEKAQRDEAAAVVVRLDTPGGLVSATRDIIRSMVAAPVPVIVYVAPSGARAASAGTFIVYAAHIAAMAPGTNIGAATPVEIGGLPGTPRQRDQSKDEKEKTDGQTAAQRKAINDTVAMLRSLAQLRGRNVEWAEKAVREAATLTAEEAARENVIEAVAGDLGALLAQIDGRTVTVAGVERTLATRDAPQVVLAPDWRTRILGVISDPNLAFILLLVGVYGILFEFWNPGALVPGIVGGISLILALTALTTLPVQYGALALLLLGIGLMTAEAFSPGFGILGIGGVVAFLAGAIFLFDPGDADIDIAVSLPLVVGAAAASAILSIFVLSAVAAVRKRPPVIGAEQMIGSLAHVVDWSETSGHIRIHGEIWSARADRTLEPGATVRVASRDGLVLHVTAA
jgi:membrane-bound serine protease (ClpP class)